MTRSATVFAAAVATTAILFPLCQTVAPKLIWNASASVPVGLYRIDVSQPFQLQDVVAVKAPEPLATFLSERGYLPKGVLLLKHVLAVPGQTVCRQELTIAIDGVVTGFALKRDRAGRNLPAWQGCLRVPAGGVFLMNPHVPDSLDGRYFGLISSDRVVGRAIPLWTYENGVAAQNRALTR